MIKMPSKRRRRHLLPVRSDECATNSVDKLAFKYMEMCKMESSTDSESDISPRWSDTSTMGCVSSAPESRPVQRTLPMSHKPVGRHPCYSLFLDPYDGSSEDSDESSSTAGVPSRRPRQQGGGGRFLSRNRRLILHNSASAALKEMVKHGIRDPAAEQQHFTDVSMESGSDPELWVCELETLSSISDRSACRDPMGDMSIDSAIHAQSVDSEVHGQFDDSAVHTTRSAPCIPVSLIPVGGKSLQLLDSSSERSLSPCNYRSLYKRKLGLPGAEMVELGQRKKQCVINMEEGDSPSEVC